MKGLRHSRACAALGAAALLLESCGGGTSTSTASNSTISTGTTTTAPTSVFTPPALEALTTGEVGQVVAQAVAEAKARALPSTIAVVDRVGNVLAVYKMATARDTAQVTPNAAGNLDAQGVVFPATMGAIAKAITSAYLSSGGNAFTTRTASEIVQEQFPPAPNAVGLESGPLFGVQFSSLPCSDLNTRYTTAAGAAALIGPKRSPLGLSADPGSVPLYKNGVLVGAVGVMGDGMYGADRNITDVDTDSEEYVALAGSTGFAAPDAITADKVAIDGTALRFIDAVPSGLKSTPASAPGFATINGTATGSLASVRGYYAQGVTPALLAGTPYGSEASGYRRATAAEFSNTDAYVLSDGSGTNRYAPRGGTDAGDGVTPLTVTEVRALLEEAFSIMSRARAAIRRPLDSRAQVTISVVDSRGVILGIVRGPDAPVFGTDVSLQKARTAAFLSNTRAAAELTANPSADVSGRVALVRAFFGDQTALTGKTAFSDRGVGSISRPFFPDGEVSGPYGPLSRPIAQFSPFSTGLQSALVIGNLAQHIGYVQSLDGSAADTPQKCTQQPDVAGTALNRVANGLQVFPGSHPIYRGSTLVGAIGISGDGIDQDDMISFLGLANAGKRTGTIGLAAAAMRSDQVVVPLAGGRTARLLYVQCPFAPFVDTSAQNVCEGI